MYQNIMQTGGSILQYGHLNAVVLLDFVSKKTELLILSLGLATCVINLLSTKLILC